MTYQYVYEADAPMTRGESPHRAKDRSINRSIIFGITGNASWIIRPLTPEEFQGVLLIGLDQFKWWNDRHNIYVIKEMVEVLKSHDIDLDSDLARVTARLYGFI